MKELQKEVHTPETDEYGISSFVYRQRRPFHPERLQQWLEEWPEEVVRAKGIVWIASRNHIAGNISQAGPSIQFGPAGYWIDTLPEAEKRMMIDENPEVKKDWDEQWGDRITEVVFIGIELVPEEIISSLDLCLLTEEEMQGDWSKLKDPLPKWIETVSA